MWVGIEGIPGSGKSYEAVAFHILPALRAGRKVITNLPLLIDQIRVINPEYGYLLELRKYPAPVRGTWDADAASRGEMAFKLFEDGRMEPAPDVPVFGHVWDFYDTWRGKDGIGALYVVDECHNAWPKGLAPSGHLKEVIQWAKLSRHFGADVTGITQNWRDVHPSLSTLLASLIKLRKADILGKSGYIRKVHGGFRGAELSREKRDYDPDVFPFYKSHTQGQAVKEAGLSDVSPFLVKFNRAKWFVLAAGLASVVWAFWPKAGKNWLGVPVSITAKTDDMPSVTTSPSSAPASMQAQPVSVALSSPASEPEPAPIPEPFEPLRGKFIHLTGSIKTATKTVNIFAVSVEGRTIFELTTADLIKAGYTFTELTDCIGILEYPGISKRPITCDPPINQTGAENRPVVYDSGKGIYSDDRHLQNRNGGASPAEAPSQTLTIDHTPSQVAERTSNLARK